jgi:glycosyltransferase involved in cell wall biosynthesis
MTAVAKPLRGSFLQIYVFSYNRPQYLENCLASLKRHAWNFDITVIDDGSDDEEVHEVLAKYRENIDTVIVRSDPASHIRKSSASPKQERR